MIDVEVLVRHLVEFPLQDGGAVLIEVDDAPAGGPVTRGWGDRRITDQAQQTFEAAIGRVEPAARALLARLRDLPESPEEVEVEFGLQLSAEAGAFIAAASSTANFKVTMTWRRRVAQVAGGGADAVTPGP